MLGSCPGSADIMFYEDKNDATFTFKFIQIISDGATDLKEDERES